MISTRIDSKTEDTYKNLSSSQKRSWRNQDKFLKAYSETRSKTVACSYAGVKYRTVMKWQKENYFGFMDRLEEADLLFCEGLEQLALERVKMQDAKSNPVLLIALLNANLPNKYRPTVVMNDDTAKDVLRELRTMAKDSSVTESTETNESEETAIEQVNKILNEKGGMA
jgi:hypothetical protein